MCEFIIDNRPTNRRLITFTFDIPSLFDLLANCIMLEIRGFDISATVRTRRPPNYVLEARSAHEIINQVLKLAWANVADVRHSEVSTPAKHSALQNGGRLQVISCEGASSTRNDRNI